MQVVVDKLLTHYEIAGSGPAIILLHGWGDNLHTFDQLSKTLSTKYTVVRVDLPGFGQTEVPLDNFNLEKYSEFIAHFLEKIEIENLFAVIGHSNGGAIAIKALSSNRFESSKLVLLASSGIRSEYKGRKKAYRIIAKSIKYPTKLLPRKTQTRLKKKAYSTIGSDMFVAENMQQTFKAVISEDLLEQSKNIKVKTILIYGTEDQSTPIEYGIFYETSIPGSKLYEISGAGHFLHQTHNNETTNIITAFLEQK